MKFKCSLFIILISFFLSCSSDDDKPTETLLLSEFEKSLIPFQEETNLQFLSDTDVEYTALASAVNIDLYFNPGDEANWNNEVADNDYNIVELNLNIKPSIARLPYERTAFYIIVDLNDTRELFALEGCPEQTISLESLMTDIEINGLLYTDVYVFYDDSSCTSTSENSTVEVVIYSKERGVEYIEFEDGSYLVQD